MSDIELRFLERAEEFQSSGETATARIVRVLQWRKLMFSAQVGPEMFTQWTEWEDVPLVREQS